MSFQTKTCVVVSCDGCTEPWGDDDGEPHFGSEAEAVEYLRGGGWIVTEHRQPNQPSPYKDVWCPSCAAKKACDLVGHTWMQWRDLEMEGVCWKARDCEHCTESQTDPPREQIWTLLDVAQVLDGRDDAGGEVGG